MAVRKQSASSVTTEDKGAGSKKPVSVKVAKPVKPFVPWSTFLETADDGQIKTRFTHDCQEIWEKYTKSLHNYCLLALLDADSSISSFELNRIFGALHRLNPAMDKDVLLVLLSPGGGVEPAYQISKLCKGSAKDKFVVSVPRQAKSAATLLAVGADEIHMGPLGHLGPIDPQLGGPPALGVTQALERIAALSERFPGSSTMFAEYLRLALTVEQIGYCERITESAVQYAERLLATKPSLPSPPARIAHDLVYKYKDHGFVIDLDEASDHLGKDWILTATEEVKFAEEIYNLLEGVNLFLRLYHKKRILVVGDPLNTSDVLVFSQT